MNRNNLNKTFMMISNLKKNFGLYGLHKKNQPFKGSINGWKCFIAHHTEFLSH